VRWGATYPGDFVPSGKVAYINRVYDTVYFADRSWFLDLLQHPPRQDKGSWRYELETRASRDYVDQLDGIRNIAIPWRRLVAFLISDHTMSWLQNLPSLKELIVLVGSTEKERREKPVQFSPIEPDTVRAASAEKLLWWIGKCLETFQSKFPDHTIPRVLVATTSDEKNLSNNAEVTLKGYIDSLYDHTARPHFGPFVPDI
jgi:hypothetical protein